MKSLTTKMPILKNLLPIVLALIFFIFTFVYFPFREKFHFDTDEGLNLMRSMLTVKGYALYTDISSDQPPLFTEILAALFRVTGFKVNVARILVLIFSCILVWAGAQLLQIVSGKLAAALFLPLIVITPQYLKLSVSVMIGVPSIALVVVSIMFLALWHKDRHYVWLVLSAFAMTCSLLIKLFTGFLVPIIVLGLILYGYGNDEKTMSWKKVLYPTAIWTICFSGLVVLLVVTLVKFQNLSALIIPHILAETEEKVGSNPVNIDVFLASAAPLILFSIVCAIYMILKRKWLLLYLTAWASLAYIILLFHSPVFYHHQLLITVPLAILAAAGTGEGIHNLIHQKRVTDLIRLPSLIALGLLMGYFATMYHYLPSVGEELYDTPHWRTDSLRGSKAELNALRTLEEFPSDTHWIVTDMPMFAFRANLMVPPRLATFSSKLLVTGELTLDDILDTMRNYKPEQVLIARFTIPQLEDYLKKNYMLVFSEDYIRIFIRSDLIH